MNKLSAVFLSLACLAGAAHAQPYNNWVSSDGTVWKNGTNEYCWRNSSWTPATAHPNCDGAIAPKKVEVGAPVVSAPAASVAPAAPVAAVTPPAAPVAVAPAKVTFSASAFFDTNKAVLKAEGKAQLDDLLAKLKSVNWDVLVAVGHADSRGPADFNQDLSVRRAEAVKAYLLNKGLAQQQVKTEGKGSSMPVADNSTEAGRAKNRRVEIEVVGTAK